MAEPSFPFTSTAASCPSPPSFPRTYLLPSLLGVTEPAGSTVARGTGIPGLGLAFGHERDEPSPCTGTGPALSTPLPMQMLEVALESQASRRDAPREQSTALAGRWGSQPARGHDSLPLSCSGLFCCYHVRRARSLALPPAPLLPALWCSPADCHLPGSAHCPFTCRTIQSSCPVNAQRRASCCCRGQGAHIHHTECRLSHDLGEAGTVLCLHTRVLGALTAHPSRC